MFTGKKTKYKKYLIGLLEKGGLEESDELKLTDFAKKINLPESKCAKIRSDILLKEAKPLTQHIAITKSFGVEQEKRLKALALKHRIDASFGDEFREYRKNWLEEKNKNEKISKERPLPKNNIKGIKVPDVEQFDDLNLPEDIRELKLNLLALIEYKDAKEQLSKRRITIKSVCSSFYDDDYYLKAFCHEREAVRNFKLSRVLSFVDIETGEVVTDLSNYFMDRFNNSPIGIITSCFQEFEPEILIMTYIARADGYLRKKERILISEFLQNNFNQEMNMELLDTEIRRTYCTNNKFRKVIKRMKIKQNEKQQELVVCLRKIIDTDKTIDPMEKGALDLIEKEFNIKKKE